MSTRIAIAMLLVGCRCLAGLPPVEGELGPPPPAPSEEELRRRSVAARDNNSDDQYPQWRFKFYTGSEKRLGTARDEVAINAQLPRTLPLTLRWVSRSGVVVLSACRYVTSSSGRPERCLYVFERHGTKWEVTHHYHLHSSWIGLTSRCSRRLGGLFARDPMVKILPEFASGALPSGG